MSGHSKWSTIKRAKGAADVKRGQAFTKLANVITIVVKTNGSGDPDFNPKLREAMEAAKAVNMPKENVQRAIDRGLGKLPGQTLEEVVYEGFGPGKTAFVVEGVTDNKLRTLQEIKNIFERGGGNLTGQGSVIYMFDRVGEIKVKSQNKNRDDEMLELIDFGATDVEDYMEDGVQKYLVYVAIPELNTVSNKITQTGYAVEYSGMILKPNVIMSIDDPRTAEKVLEFAQKLEDLDDVQKVFANFDIDEKLI